jgi:uncharacterized protein (DUF433 family)
VYTFSEAAAILGRGEDAVTSRQVYYWIRTGLTPPSLEALGRGVLSFHDLISLEIVRRFRARGVSLQKVRRVEERLRSVYEERERPLAYEVFFTDGASIWAKETGDLDPKLIEVAGKRPDHYVWTDSITTFAEEIEFEGHSRRASSWTPAPWVSIDPDIQFGTPVVAGTRVPVRTVGANLKVATPGQVADWYGLTIRQVLGVRDYLTVT